VTPQQTAVLTASLIALLSSPLAAAPRVSTVVLPPVTFTQDDGLGLGVYVGVQKKSPEDEKRAIERPWLWDFGVIAMIYLKPHPVAWGAAGTLSWAPKRAERIELVLNLGSHGWHQDQWFGLGNNSSRDLRKRAEEDPVLDPWHRFGLYQGRLDARIYYRLLSKLDLFAAVILTYNRVAVRENTLLEQQLASGILASTGSGFLVSLDAGLRFDTRDSRIDPTKGVLLTGTVQGTFGSPGPSGRLALDVSGYVAPPNAPVVFAGSLLVQRQFGEVPFYEYGVIVGPEAKPRHLSGVGGVRGIARGRIRGPDGLLLHGEVRFRPPGFPIGKLFQLRLEPIIFVDATRVGTLGLFSEGPALHPGMGTGCRFVIAEQTLFRIDVGAAPELQQDEHGTHAHWNVGVYGTIGQSF
jgi:hypothetical protein